MQQFDDNNNKPSFAAATSADAPASAAGAWNNYRELAARCGSAAVPRRRQRQELRLVCQSEDSLPQYQPLPKVGAVLLEGSRQHCAGCGREDRSSYNQVN